MNRIALFFLLSAGIMPVSPAVEILRWERLPLAVPLRVGQERVILVDRNLRVGVPSALADRLRVQSSGGALYLHANAPIEPTRLQLQDAESGAVILIDVTAKQPDPHEPALEPIRIIDGEQASIDDARPASPPSPRNQQGNPSHDAPATPIPVVLTRYAAQSLYAPLRTVEPASGVRAVSVQRSLPLDTLLSSLPVRATALAAWRLEDYWLTAIALTNTSTRWLMLDPRALQGDFVAATFQHRDVGPSGDSTDTTVVYLVTRGRALREALLPAISPIDAAAHLPHSTGEEGESREK